MTISETLLVKLKDPSLAVDKGLIGAEWLDRSDSGKTFDVSNRRPARSSPSCPT